MTGRLAVRQAGGGAANGLDFWSKFNQMKITEWTDCWRKTWHIQSANYCSFRILLLCPIFQHTGELLLRQTFWCWHKRRFFLCWQADTFVTLIIFIGSIFITVHRICVKTLALLLVLRHNIVRQKWFVSRQENDDNYISVPISHYCVGFSPVLAARTVSRVQNANEKSNLAAMAQASQ